MNFWEVDSEILPRYPNNVFYTYPKSLEGGETVIKPRKRETKYQGVKALFPRLD